MATRVYNLSETKADLYNRITTDGEHELLLGDSVAGDIVPILFRYDINSSATDDFPRVIKPTLQTGNGRWLRVDNYFFPPIGAIVAWSTNTAPTGYLLCNGTAVSRTTYKDLYDVIGTTYGSGNGSTTFNLPDISQKFILGKSSSGTGSNIGDTGGQIDHVHSVNPPATNTGGPSGTVTNLGLLGIGAAASDSHNHSVDIPAFDSGSNNPPYITLNFIIRF